MHVTPAGVDVRIIADRGDRGHEEEQEEDPA